MPKGLYPPKNGRENLMVYLYCDSCQNLICLSMDRACHFKTLISTQLLAPNEETPFPFDLCDAITTAGI